MGVRGFQSFLKERRNGLLQMYHLQNTHVVIDGLNVMYDMSDASHDGNSGFFGGNYDRFEHDVTQFFQNLAECNVTPIVIFDGVNTVKSKEDAITKFTNDIIKAEKQKRDHKLLLMWDVFLMVLRKMKIKFIKCFLEADDTIASVAKILNCPVVGCDADFCFYGVKFIIFKSFHHNIKNSDTGKVYPCEIFRTEKLKEKFQHLELSILPLSLMLLRNNEVKSSRIFYLKDDIDSIVKQVVPRIYDRNTSPWHHRIETVIRWLSQFSSCDHAVQRMLDLIPTHRHKIFRELTEEFLNDFSSPSVYALNLLGLKRNDSILEKNSEGFVMKKKETKMDNDFLTEEELLSSFPEWFMQDIASYDMNSIFIDLITKSLFRLRPCIEINDPNYSSTHEISVPIIASIVSLLMTKEGSDGESTVAVDLLMMEKDKFIRKEKIFQRGSVPLQDLRNLNMSLRKKIIDEALGIHGKETLDCVPEEWKLYIGTVIFWMNQETPPKKNRNHMICLLLSMLFGVIDREIGFHRWEKTFEKEYGDQLIQRSTNLQSNIQRELTVTTALNSVSKNDCIAAASFFIRNFSKREDFWMHQVHASKTIHVFGQFQCCLLHSSELNDLLGLPYARPPIGKLFNGTLLYNLYIHFLELSDVDEEIERVLGGAPSLLAVFKSLEKVVSRNSHGKSPSSM